MLLFPYDLVLFYTWLGAPFCLVKIYDMLLSDAASWSSVHRMSCALREKLNFNSCWSYSYSSWWCLVLFLSSFGSLFTCCFCFCCYGTCKCSLDPLVPLLTANWSYLLPNHEDLRSIVEINLLCPVLLWFIILVTAQMFEYLFSIIFYEFLKHLSCCVMDGSDMLGFDEWIGYIIFMNIICLQCNGGRAPHGNNLPNAAGDSPTRRGEHARVTMVQGFSTAGRDFPGNTPLLFQTSPLCAICFSFLLFVHGSFALTLDIYFVHVTCW